GGADPTPSSAALDLLVALWHGAADDAADVAAVLFLGLEEGLVVVVADRLIIGLEFGERVISLHIGCLGRRRTLELGLLGRRTARLLRCSSDSAHGSCGQHLIDRAADRAGDRITVQIIEPGTTRRALARPLGTTFGFHRHGSASR